MLIDTLVSWPYKLGICIAALALAYYSGGSSVRSAWHTEKVAQEAVRVQALADQKSVQDKLNADVTRKYETDMSNLRDRLSNAERLRIPSNVPSAHEKPANSSIGTDTRTRMVSGATQKSIDELEQRIETVFAACRAAQALAGY